MVMWKHDYGQGRSIPSTSIVASRYVGDDAFHYSSEDVMMSETPNSLFVHRALDVVANGAVSHTGFGDGPYDQANSMQEKQSSSSL